MFNSEEDELFTAALWLLFEGRELFPERTMELLRQIDSTGSLAKAAQLIPMSYKTAWAIVERLNSILSSPIVVSVSGGRHGGGSRLSEYGKNLLLIYFSLENMYRDSFPASAGVIRNAEQFFKKVGHGKPKISYKIDRLDSWKRHLNASSGIL